MVSTLHFRPGWWRRSATRQLPCCRDRCSRERFLERSSRSELERQRRHHHVARAVGVGDGPGQRRRPIAPLGARVGAVRPAGRALGAHDRAGLHGQLGEVELLAGIARRPDQDVGLHAARDQRSAAAGRSRRARARARAATSVRGSSPVKNAASKRREVVPGQRIVERRMRRSRRARRACARRRGSITAEHAVLRARARRAAQTSTPSSASTRAAARAVSSSPSAV